MIQNFKFSPFITLVSISLAILMLTASYWQWERYLWKKDIVDTYKANENSKALELKIANSKIVNLDTVLNKKVKLRGSFDYDQQIIVINRKHKTGAGYWLLAPFKLHGSNQHLILSRGFIPFRDAEPKDWKKYDFKPNKDLLLYAVVQETIERRTFISPKSKASNEEFAIKWLYPDIKNIAKQYNYPIVQEIYLQQLGGSQTGEFPAESISVRVPPSTHFGYMIEWAILAILSLAIGFILQVFRNRRKIK